MLKNISKFLASIIVSVSLMFMCISPVMALEEASMIKLGLPDQTTYTYSSYEEAVEAMNEMDMEGQYVLVMASDLVFEEDVVLPLKDLLINGQGFMLKAPSFTASSFVTLTNIVLDTEIINEDLVTYTDTATFVEEEKSEDPTIIQDDEIKKEPLEKPDTNDEDTTEEKDEEEQDPIVQTNSWTREPVIGSSEYGQPLNMTAGVPAFGLAEDVIYTFGTDPNGEFNENIPVQAGTWYMKAELLATEAYTGLETILKFEITPKQVVNVTIPEIHDDTSLKDMEVKDGETVLVLGTDYSILEEKKDDTVIVTIDFKGNYSGQIIKTYQIEQEEVKPEEEKPATEQEETKITENKEDVKEDAKKTKTVKTSTQINQAMWIMGMAGALFLAVLLALLGKYHKSGS